MSRAGQPYDNAPMERYHNTLKAELDYGIAEYSYGWYNQIRTHFYNGYLTPHENKSV